jgi:hypothetical protein
LEPPNTSANAPAEAIEQATPTSPWQPTSAPEIDAFILDKELQSQSAVNKKA